MPSFPDTLVKIPLCRRTIRSRLSGLSCLSSLAIAASVSVPCAGGAHPLPERHTLGEFLDRRDVRAREVHAIAVERDLNADRWRVWTEIELPREGAQRDRGAIVGRAGALDIPGRAQ